MKTSSRSFLFENEIARESAGEGIVRQIMGYDEQLMLVKVEFDPGAVGSIHSHYHTQSTYVASGEFEFTIDGETKTVKTGDGLYIGPDIIHGCKCLKAGVLIDTFSPMREDFLAKK